VLKEKAYKFKTNGEWIDAIAEPDELVINVGDMLSRHTTIN
jgi:isopenicillin N synthase-like dioxygenase